MEANPILEAFGNAKTVRNNNSSRFGKLVEVFFNDRYHISGARVNSYLLERSRIVAQSLGERNYHIFYQLLSGLDDKEREALHLKDAHPAMFELTKGTRGDNHNNTNAVGGTNDPLVSDGNGNSNPSSGNSGDGEKKKGETEADRADDDAYVVPGIDDCEEYQRLIRAMIVLKFDHKEVNAILKTLAALLHLSNIVLVQDGEGCQVQGDKCVSIVSDLLSIDRNNLLAALTEQKKMMGRDLVTTRKSLDKAKASVAALIKGIYSAQFDYIIDKINIALSSSQGPIGGNSSIGGGNGPSKGTPMTNQTFIGVLDIFGFEIFETNAFEQLCINYTNEKMQQHFNQQVFQMELVCINCNCIGM